MKKIRILLLFAVLLCAGAASCAADDFGTAVVNGRNSSKVHLREEATSDSESKGLFFTGTEVEMRSEPDEKWVKVRMGGLSGYMSSAYLTTGSRRDQVGKRFQRGTVKAANYAYFRNGPSKEHMVIDRIDAGESVTIMGETSEGWYYIEHNGDRGYISGNLVRITGSDITPGSSDIAYDPDDSSAAVQPSFSSASSLPRSLPVRWTHMSGAGAWSTEMNLDQNGFFYGYFHDSEADRVYESDFSGHFSNIRRRDAYSYTMTLTGFHVFGTPGEAQARYGVLYITQEPAGLQKGDTFVLYTPGTPLNMISQEERSWLHDQSGTTLRTYLLSNQNSGRGFIPGATFQ